MHLLRLLRVRRLGPCFASGFAYNLIQYAHLLLHQQFDATLRERPAVLHKLHALTRCLAEAILEARRLFACLRIPPWVLAGRRIAPLATLSVMLRDVAYGAGIGALVAVFELFGEWLQAGGDWLGFARIVWLHVQLPLAPMVATVSLP